MDINPGSEVYTVDLVKKIRLEFVGRLLNKEEALQIEKIGLADS